MFDWQLVVESLPMLGYAALNTVKLTFFNVALGTVLAIPLTIARQSSNSALSRGVAAYSWFMRTCPLLILLYFLYYGLPTLGIYLPAFGVAVVGGGIMTAAYYTEIIRGGVLAVPSGQWDAARALGLSPWRIWRRIVLPQAIPVALPPYISDTTLILKGSSLASIITVDELTGVGNSIISTTYRPLEILLVVAAVYLALNSLLTLAQHWGERHWAVRR